MFQRICILLFILFVTQVHGASLSGEAAKCGNALRDVTPFSLRNQLIATNTKGTSKFEIVHSSIPTVRKKTFRGSSKEEIDRELTSIDLKALAKKDFLVFLDMDDTLLEQWAPFFIEGYHSFTIRENDQVDWFVALTPQFANLLKAIRSMNGGIILYSRNDIQRVEALADLVPIEGRSLRSLVDGVLGGPYVKDAVIKDLTVVHHHSAIILDDSPGSVVPHQWSQVIPIEKFKPNIVNLDQNLVAAETSVHPSWIAGLDEYKVNLSNTQPSIQQFMNHHQNLMKSVIGNIRSAYTKSKVEKIPFLVAIRPYSYAAQRKP